MRSVFDRLGGTVTDTRHTVGAGIAPDQLSVFQPDIVKRTHADAFAAGHAAVGGIEFFCMDKHRIEKVIYNVPAFPMSPPQVRTK